MAARYIVTRLRVVHKRKMYCEGDLLPVEFTERDRARNIYTRRIGLVDVPDVSDVSDVPDEPKDTSTDSASTIIDPPVVSTPQVIDPPADKPVTVPTTIAENKPSVVKPTGTTTPPKVIPAKPTVSK